MHVRHAVGLLAALTLALSAGHPTDAGARDARAGDLLIKHPWSRATPAGAQVAGGYVSIVNTGRVPDRLVDGSFEASSGFQLHEMASTGGVMTMRAIGPVTIPAGGTLTLSPMGQHVMLTGLKHGLMQGQTVAGTLVFERAGTVPVEFDVEAIGAKAPDRARKSGDPSMPGMDMD